MEGVTDSKVEGIGGWLLAYLVLVGYGIITIPLQIVNSYSSPLVGKLTLALLILSLLINLSIFILIFTKKSWVPKYIISTIWTLTVLNLFNMGSIIYSNPTIAKSAGILALGMGFVIVANIILTFYFIKSERVKNTFVK